MTRKHASDMFMSAEAEARRAETTRLATWQFYLESNKETYMNEVTKMLSVHYIATISQLTAHMFLIIVKIIV